MVINEGFRICPLMLFRLGGGGEGERGVRGGRGGSKCSRRFHSRTSLIFK